MECVPPSEWALRAKNSGWSWEVSSDAVIGQQARSKKEQPQRRDHENSSHAKSTFGRGDGRSVDYRIGPIRTDHTGPSSYTLSGF